MAEAFLAVEYLQDDPLVDGDAGIGGGELLLEELLQPFGGALQDKAGAFRFLSSFSMKVVQPQSRFSFGCKNSCYTHYLQIKQLLSSPLFSGKGLCGIDLLQGAGMVLLFP